MSPEARARVDSLIPVLVDFDRNTFRLPGAPGLLERRALAGQVVESERRVAFVRGLRQATLSPDRCDPHSHLFDPLRAAVLFDQRGNRDEAFGLAFLATHCGRHRTDGWRLAALLYGGEGRGQEWTWNRLVANPDEFGRWLGTARRRWQTAGNVPRFGNHRKYESLDPMKGSGTNHIVSSYVEWVGPEKVHERRLGVVMNGETDPGNRFELLYESMATIHRFGRMARFDHIAMLGKLGLAGVQPATPYLQGSTGPLRAAALLFRGDSNSRDDVAELETRAIALGGALGIGMQEVEDSLCNWQKSPQAFRPFRG
ncbi:MAG: hypothetical protein ACREJO_03740 [Phycisphaerales bacterium]